MDKRRSCANSRSADHHVADSASYKKGMKSLGYAPDEDEISQMEEHELYSGLIIMIGARCFFCKQEIDFRVDCPLFWEAESPKTQVSAAVQNITKRQGESDLQNKDVIKDELSTKSIKRVNLKRNRNKWKG